MKPFIFRKYFLSFVRVWNSTHVLLTSIGLHASRDGIVSGIRYTRTQALNVDWTKIARKYDID